MSTQTHTDNSSLSLKVAVSRWVWDHIPERRVLDLFCGQQGWMYQGIWHEASEYLGVDKFRPHRLATTLKVSAERAVGTFDLSCYTIFDVDTYTTPWVVARRICVRRGPGRFGMALTLGDERGLKNGHSNEITRRMIGASGLSDYRLLVRYRQFIQGLLLRSIGEMPGITLVEAVKGEVVKQSTITYIGLVVDKQV